ncbi:MAG: N-acetylmuramoyl-L-alanine amidase family protein [Longimicrobiales bacterium]
MKRHRRSRLLRGTTLPILIPVLLGPVGAQENLAVRTPDGPLVPGIELSTHRGYAAFPAREMERLGWQVVEEEGRGVIRWGPSGPRIEVLPEIPFILWDGDVVHLADPPYRAEGGIYLPVQVLVDVLPWKLPRAFDYRSGSWELEILPPAEPARRSAPAVVPPSGTRQARPPGNVDPVPQRPVDPTRVVIIDAGHGGRDPGTVGTRGTQEKAVALGIALELADLLREEPTLEVHLTRDDDTLVPLWRRGELATRMKGDRYGVFISIHANALPNSAGTRGFETYFLSEARTEHERRVAALENAAVEFEDDEGEAEQVEDMSFILSELRNLDHQHWSALLAEYIQGELARVHPGPNRGVKQGPFAVITNTLMPAVLVEVGFLSNREEESLLTREGFQEEAAGAVADAVLAFFGRYPPGPDGGGGSSGRGGAS